MGLWTLTHTASEQTKTFAAWGLCEPIIDLVSFDVSSASFDHTGAEFDSAPVFAPRDEVVIKLDDAVVFRGQVIRTPRGLHGSSERLGYLVHDCFHNLTRLTYQQTWAGLGNLSQLVLFANDFGGFQTAGQVFRNVIQFATARGLPVQIGSTAGITVSPPTLDVRDQKCSQVLQLVRGWCPDVCTRMDYSTSPTTMHFIPRAEAAVHTLDALQAANDIDIEDLHEDVVPEVVIDYRYHNMVGDEEQIVTVRDSYPPDRAGLVENAVVMSIELGGFTRQQQSLATVNISPDALWWWRRYHPWLADVTGGSFTIEDGEISVPVDDDEDGPNTYGWVNEVTDGAIPAWLNEGSGPVCGAVKVKAVARNFTYKGRFIPSMELTATLMATSLGGGVYYRDDYSMAESVAIGVAEDYWNSVNPLQRRGLYVIQQDEIDLALPRPGSLMNLTGGQSEARGWTEMNALVQRVTLNIHLGQTSITFGPPEHLGIQDAIELSRARRGLPESRLVQERAGTAGSSRRTLGPRSTPNGHGSTPPQAGSSGSNLVVSEVSAGVFTITSGRVNNVAVKKDSIGGAVITNASPPSWTRDDGVLYLGIHWPFSTDRGSLTTAASAPTCFVKDADELPAEDEEAGEYVYPLATIVGGHITDNDSPGHNLWAKLFGIGDDKCQITVV